MAAKKPKVKALVRLEYDSNNSGGYWWLKDEDWQAMEKAGWVVEWGGLYFCNSEFACLNGGPKPVVDPPCPLPKKVEGRAYPENPCPGHRLFQSYDEAKASKYRWLGALAKGAYIMTDDPKRTIREWEDLTGQDAAEEGCNCCGCPHGFDWDNPDGTRGYIDVERTSSWS